MPANRSAYTLDTNAIIYYLKDDRKAVDTLQEVFGRAVPLYISAVTELELFSFSSLTPADVDQISAILNTVAVISVDSRIARMAGYLRRQYGLKLADSAIAATALFTGSILLTRNVRDFKGVVGIDIARI